MNAHTNGSPNIINKTVPPVKPLTLSLSDNQESSPNIIANIQMKRLKALVIRQVKVNWSKRSDKNFFMIFFCVCVSYARPEGRKFYLNLLRILTSELIGFASASA